MLQLVAFDIQYQGVRKCDIFILNIFRFLVESIGKRGIFTREGEDLKLLLVVQTIISSPLENISVKNTRINGAMTTEF